MALRVSFYDIYVNKIFGEVQECINCNGSGIVRYDDECDSCNGKGFLTKEPLDQNTEVSTSEDTRN